MQFCKKGQEITMYDHWLILLATLFPTGFVSAILDVAKLRPKQSQTVDTPSLAILAIVLAGILGLTFWQSPWIFEFRHAAWFWYILAICYGPIGNGVEYVLLDIPAYMQSGVIFQSVTRNSAWANLNKSMIFLMCLIAVLEEIIYRQICWSILETRMSFPSEVCIALTGFAYACNHLYFGSSAFWTKFCSGSIYAFLYWISGYEILVPILAHVSQNLFWVYWTKRSAA